MLTLQTTGYKPKSVLGDVSLGIFKGIDNGLWAYGFAAIIFAGALSAFMPVMLVILLVGWALMSLFTGLTSSVRVHLVNLDEQAVVILSTIAGLMLVKMGPEAATHAGLATMLTIMSLTSLVVGLSFLLVGRFHLTRLLELLPYPVICGFMAGVGWLLLQAGVGLAVDMPISIEVVRALAIPENLLRLAIMVAGAFLLMFAAKRSRHAWTLPVSALVIVAIFYLVTSQLGYSREVLAAHNWLFDVSSGSVTFMSMFTSRALFSVNVDFVLSVFPQILTIAFLALLTASMSLSAMIAGGHSELVTAHEMQSSGVGNVALGLIGCPPVYNDVTSSLLYSRFGASSRTVVIVSGAVTLCIALIGSQAISWMPTVLVGSVVFLFAFTMLYDWMYESVRGFQPVDYAIVCIILGTVIFVGFMAGVFVGVMMALLLFVMRYSMISAVQGQYSLAGYRSSVERSPHSNRLLDEQGARALVYSLRGFLFFGTANAVLDLIRDESGIKGGNFRAILLDLKRVTGMDISALKTFLQIRRICEASGVQLMYSGVTRGTDQRIVMMGAVSMEQGQPLFFKEADYAVEYIENLLLEELGENVETKSVATYLQELLHDQDKVRILMSAMDRVEIGVGQTLFQQGDDDTGLFMLEHGSMTALIGTKTSGMKRVKKFNAGSVIGEMSSYTPDKKRTATIIANEPSVLYHLSSKKMASMDESDSWLVSSIHELVARTLGARISYMNRRLIQELK